LRDCAQPLSGPNGKISLMIMKTHLTFFFLLTSLLSYSQERLVKVNGHNFNVYAKGLENRKKNSPVIVFENGMGVGIGTWDTILEQVSKFAPVFAYDRSGIEKSDRVFQMPTVKRVAENLKSLLTALNIPPPYILVGHSMGGLYARGYAGIFSDEISGLILIDPADFTESKDNWNSIFRTLGVPEKRIDEMMYDRLYKKAEADSVRFGPWSEGQVLTELRRTDFAEISRLPLPNSPICFIVGGKFEVPVDRRSKDFDHAEFFVVKSNRNMERWRKLIDLSPKGGSLIYLSNCGHYVHRDDPAAVINVVQSMWNSLK
jgi:pimeloyl-ACP methyl ester carboxylesterase